MQKRNFGPCPIFRSGNGQPFKRPRQAVIAHPNNIFGKENQGPSMDNHGPSIGNQHKTFTGPSPTGNCGPLAPPPIGNYGPPAILKSVPSKWEQGSYHIPSYHGPPLGGERNQGPSPGERNPPGPLAVPAVAPSWNKTTTTTNRSNYYRAEPTFHDSIVHPDTSLQQLTQSTTFRKIGKPSTRVVTATGNGLKGWAGISAQQHVLFEIYGVLTSQVIINECGSKEFLIRTSDGQLKCIFWEIDRNLPLLVRGKLYRVVGCMDYNRSILKCYSVRLSKPDEDRHLHHHLKISTNTLHQLTATSNEP